MVEDLQDGDDVVVEEAPLGRRHFTQEGSFGRYHNLPLLGAGLSNTSKKIKDPPIRRRSIVRLKSLGRIFTPGGLPAISANQRTLLLFNPLMTSHKIVKL